ncbi:MAG: MFS transporter [Myxococcota bacterium]|nr:MFS transporter [Myxococcota bacterium]
MARSTERARWHRFLWLWAAEMLSITGTGLTAFALGAWVYARTQSATDFAMLSVAAILPGVLLLPVGGVLADLLPRKRVMVWCNAIAGACAITLGVLLYLDNLALGVLYALLALGAFCRALQWVTFTATMTQMVPASQMGRTSAMIYVGEAGQQLVAPALAALALPWIGHVGVIGMDTSTFLFALLVLAALPIPDAPESSADDSRLRVILSGWRFIRERPGLLFLQVFFALSQFFGGFLPILTLPALMELTRSEQTTGVTMGIAGAGLLVGMGVLVARPVRRRRVHATLLFDLLASIALVTLAVGAARFGAPWVACFGFVFLFFHAMESGVSQDLWQRKVPGELQGRVFAIRRTISWLLVPVCYALAGPIVDDWFTPMMRRGGAWHDALSPHFGDAKLGAILVLMAASGLLRGGVLVPLATRIDALMRIEEQLPDHIDGAEAR